ncbi:MAG: 23S rRNA (uracil(1939)-C(5))-methyltransferase RlmD [Bacteroidales bacterium]
MGRKKNRKPYLEKVEITDFGAEGKALGKVNEKVVFVPFTAPGDIVDVQVSKKRKSFMVGRAEKFHQYSELRIEPFCKHFGVCGGCKWQHVPYDKQLEFKQQQVTDQLKRIGHLDIPEVSPILGSDKTQYYRNKLEFTFSNMKWVTDYSDDMDFDQMNMNGLGFHPPGMFDRILDLEECYLQPDLSNVIRKRVKELAEHHGYPFYNARKKEGLLRNVLIRNNENDQWMVVLILNSENKEALENILKPLKQEIPQITSTMYIVNNKLNDSLDGLQAKPFEGETYLTETLEDLLFKVGPLSFFQTNTAQALKMYRKIRSFADIQPNDIVYDLYTGTGSIALFVADQARKVVGIEYVPEAIHDANVNKEWNNVENAEFFAGDMVEVLNDDFITEQGRPRVIITDPPRAGMHKDVIKQILKVAPQRIVYVSCNPATQARDVALLNDEYKIIKVQPVDMFPHTHHVENIMLLERLD